MPEMFDDLTCLVVFHQPRHEKICSSNWESSSPGIGMKIKKTFELPPTSWWLGSWALGRFFLPKWADKSLHRSFDSEWLCELFLLTACCREWSISICFFHFQGWLCIQSLFHQWKLTAGTQKWSFGSDEFPLHFGLFSGSMYPPHPEKCLRSGSWFRRGWRHLGGVVLFRDFWRHFVKDQKGSENSKLIFHGQNMMFIWSKHDFHIAYLNATESMNEMLHQFIHLNNNPVKSGSIIMTLWGRPNEL